MSESPSLSELRRMTSCHGCKQAFTSSDERMSVWSNLGTEEAFEVHWHRRCWNDHERAVRGVAETVR
jgi:hypothetical protein